MPETISTLLYGSAIDISGLEKSARAAREQIKSIGDFATKTFDENITRTLANSVRADDLTAGVNRAKGILNSLGVDVSRNFERTLGRNLARQSLQPFVEESSTFLGQLKKNLISVKDVAVGSFTGFLAADLAANIIRNIGRIGAAAVRIATDAVETRSKFNEVFKDIADQTRIWANSFADSVGRARIDVEGWLAALQDTFVPLGFARKEAADFSQTLVKLAVDVASFNNQADAKVIEDFQSAIVGNAETVRKYGIVILKTTIEQEALRQGLNKTFEQLTEQEKAWLRLQIIIQGSVDAQGDAIRTAESLANQQKRLEANLKNLGESIGAFLIPAINRGVTGINELFALFASSEIDRFNAALRTINVDEATLNFEIFGDTITAAKDRVGELDEEINNLILSGIKLDAVTRITRGLFDAGAVGLDNLRRATVELSKSEEGRIEIQARINSAIQAAQQIEKEKQKAVVAGDKDREESLKKQIIAQAEIINFSEKVLALSRQRAESERKAVLIEDFRALATTEEGILTIRQRGETALKNILHLTEQIKLAEETGQTLVKAGLSEQLRTQQQIVTIASKFVELEDELAGKSKVTVDLSKLTLEQLKERRKLYPAEAAEIDKVIDKLKEQQRLSENIAKFIANATNQLELLSAVDDTERRLIAIRQEADERRKQFADQAKAVETVNRLERAERRKTIDDFGDKLRKEIKQRIEQIVKLDIEPKLITDIKLPEIGLDEQETRTISERINRTLNKALVESPASILLNKISDIGALIDDEFINFAGTIDRGFGDLLAGIANFAANISSGNILGAITGAIGTIGKIFGGGGDKRLSKAQEEQLSAQEAAARAAERAAQALEELRRAAEAFGAGKLAEELNRLVNEFELITNASRNLTSAEVDRAAVLIKEITRLGNLVDILRTAIARATDPRQISELQRQLLEAESSLARLVPELEALGINLGNVTAAELERIKVLLEEKGIFDEAIARFQAFGDGLRGLLDKLQLGFELLDTTDPAKKLEELVAALTDAFGFKIPAQFADLNEFILAGLDAVRAGGQQLIDFLIAAGIEELGAEEFADLLRTLNEFSRGVDEVGDSIADAFGDLLDKLQLEFQLLDIEDPIKQLRRLREEVARQFGAVVPETLEGIDDLIKSGLQALLAGGDALKTFLASINLEEFTEEQFRNFLESLEGLGDEAARQIEEATAAAEEITTSQIKSITFQQANKLIDEVTTIRIVVTQMLDQMRLGALANLPNIDLNNLAAALSGLNAGARNNYFIVRNGGVEKVSENQLSDIDRRLIEQARAAAQARGIN